MISSTVNLSLKSEIEINSIENFINLKHDTILNNDLLFIGGGITISNLTNYYKSKFNIKVFSSPMLIINDAVFKIK